MPPRKRSKTEAAENADVRRLAEVIYTARLTHASPAKTEPARDKQIDAESSFALEAADYFVSAASGWFSE